MNLLLVPAVYWYPWFPVSSEVIQQLQQMTPDSQCLNLWVQFSLMLLV